MANSTWICPYCEHASVLESGKNTSRSAAYTKIDSTEGPFAIQGVFVACSNPGCRRLTVSISYGSGSPHPAVQSAPSWKGAPQSVRLLPPRASRPIPDYVPLPIREDYAEACAIIDLSPKAASTLARRALQGIIRDFHGIVDRSLAKEIEALQGRIDPLVWQAIDAVRRVGNIGAHMEKQIDVIVDVEPDEALRLTRLIELLINEWYVSRHRRQEQLNEIIALGAAKDAMRKGSSSNDTTTPAAFMTEGDAAAS